MSKYLIMKSFIVLTAALYLLIGNVLAQNKFAGTWEGSLNVGRPLRIVYHLTSEDGLHYDATMDSPDQGAFGIPCTGARVNGDSVIISLKSLACTYTGTLTDTNKISGIFKQGTASLPLELSKSYSVTVINRPQTPKPPFNYLVEDVTYQNPSHSITFAGTITIPKGAGPFPAVLLITGSGPQNRDEELFNHKPFAVIADYLTNRGYIVLRVDDRGVGKSTGDRTHATSADYADDASAGLDYLLTRPEVDKKKLGLMGHSEGGMIGPMLAAKRKDVDFVVMLAGPGIKIAQLMAEQNAAILEKGEMSADAITAYKQLYQDVVAVIIAAKDSDVAEIGIHRVVNAWKAKHDANIVYATTHIEDSASQQHFVNQFMEVYNNDWYRYFMAYDPEPVLKKLHCKVLAINGDKDIQVISKTNIPGIKAALAKSHCTTWEAKEMPGLNHLFQHCKTCTVTEYGKIEETFAPEALQTIGDWMDKHVK